MKQAIKLFFYNRLPIPHWWMWRVESGDEIYVDGLGFGRCEYRTKNHITCSFPWATKWIPLYREEVYYALPDKEIKHEPQ